MRHTMHVHERIFRSVERRIAKSIAAGNGTAWPTVRTVARGLRLRHREVEEACDGDPDGRIFLSGYNLVEERNGEPILAQHLQAYLNEYVFRFNRRFYPFNAFRSLLGIGAGSESPTYAELYSGEWKHPNLSQVSHG